MAQRQNFGDTKEIAPPTALHHSSLGALSLRMFLALVLDEVTLAEVPLAFHPVAAWRWAGVVGLVMDLSHVRGVFGGLLEGMFVWPRSFWVLPIFWTTFVPA